jgi:hypothetical protein
LERSGDIRRKWPRNNEWGARGCLRPSDNGFFFHSMSRRAPRSTLKFENRRAERRFGLGPDGAQRASILAARTLLITITGAEKRELLEQAIADGHSSNLPIGRVLAEAEQPIDIHWAA